MEQTDEVLESVREQLDAHREMEEGMASLSELSVGGDYDEAELLRELDALEKEGLSPPAPSSITQVPVPSKPPAAKLSAPKTPSVPATAKEEAEMDELVQRLDSLKVQATSRTLVADS